MRIWLLIAFMALAPLLASSPASAGQAEARETARLNNCTPKKIEIYQQDLGPEGKTIYRVQCTMAKAVGTADADKNAPAPPDSLLIDCDQNLCALIRPVTADKK